MAENEAAQEAEPRVPQAVAPAWWLRFGHRIYIHNPFYLLSVAFVLHSTRLWLNTHSWPYDPWPLMDIVGGYIVLVAVVGSLVIRWGKAWDDARSIFFILLLLFVELSLTFDPVLVPRPRLGLLLLVIGWTLAVAVSEGVFWTLRIRLPVLFRGPYHLILVLLFLYPPLIVAGLRTETVSAIWRIWAFSPVSGVALLTLLPAIRRGPSYVRNGTPWNWPRFPWCLFVFLVFCLGARSYALTLSFDSVLTQGFHDAMRLEPAFRPSSWSRWSWPVAFCCSKPAWSREVLASSDWHSWPQSWPVFCPGRLRSPPFRPPIFSGGLPSRSARRSGWRCGPGCFTLATRGSAE